MMILPIKWKLARTISGVSKRGGGPIEGRTKHVLLLEDWEHRKYGEFLCGAKIVNPLAHRIYNIEDSWSEKGSITCKKCLALVERMNKHGAVSTPRSNTKERIGNEEGRLGAVQRMGQTAFAQSGRNHSAVGQERIICSGSDANGTDGDSSPGFESSGDPRGRNQDRE